jgi:amino acid adenylation domain-containing protein
MVGDARDEMDSTVLSPGRVRGADDLTTTGPVVPGSDPRPDPRARLAPAAARAVHGAFLEQAARTPDAVALASVNGDCSYAELDAITRKWAAHLAHRGIGRGNIVAILSDRNPALVYAILGVLRSGATFYVADAAYPAARILDCVTRVRPALVVLCGEVAAPPEVYDSFESLCMPAEKGRALATGDGGGAHALASADAQGDVAYVAFTSGSTGQPKGIVTGHAPLPHFVSWHVERHGFTQKDRFSLLSGLSHDPVLRDIFTPLSVGAALCIPEQAVIFDPHRLVRWLEEMRITVCHLTPALGELIVNGADGVTLPDLRHLFWGGDVLSAKIARQMRAVAPRARQVNFYGATETPQAMAYFDLDPAPDRETFPVGKGIDGAQLLVVKGAGELVQIGVVGEIWIRSPYLSRGYLDDPAQTQARFVKNPFTVDAQDLCYRTGDLGQYLPDGNVAFAGRADHQVKIRGFRVEPDEVARKLEQLKGVSRAVVLAREGAGTGKALVAYYTRDRHTAVTSAQLRETLSRVLPAYMVPSFFVALEAFPLLPNGKIDLSALSAPAAEDAACGMRYEAPSTDRERELVALWQEVLGIQRVGVNDSFLELGGDSLSALKALIRMRKHGIPDHVARGILQGHTIAEMVAVERSGGAGLTLSREARNNLLVSVLRGLLAVLLVTDHWFAGLLKHVPAGLRFLQVGLAPAFNLATPGFAVVFGLSLGHTYYPMYRADAARVGKTLRFGGWILLAAIGAGVASDLAVISLRREALDSTGFFTLFFGSLLYYAIAVSTATIWFAAISRFRREVLATIGLMIAAYVFYRGCSAILLPREQTGFLQLCRLMLVAKFNYFNMSIGALGGVAAGLYLRGQADDAEITRRFLATGVAAVAAGLVWLRLTTGGFAGLFDSADMGLWRWFFYGGAVLVLSAFVHAVLRRHDRLPSVARESLRAVGVVGQCTLPIVMGHELVLKLKTLLVLLGVPTAVAIALTVLAFVTTITWLSVRLYQLYYGGSEVAERVRRVAA